MTSPVAALIQFGIDILNTTLGATPSSPTGTIVAQTGDAIRGTVACNQADYWQQVGFASRPSPAGTAPGILAGTGMACQALAFRCSDRDVIFATKDYRCNQVYGNIAPGETAVFAGGEQGLGQAVSTWNDDGSITHFTTDTNTAAGNAVYERVHPKKGWCFVAPWGSIVFDQTGLHVRHASGFQIDMGPVGGLPIPGMSSYCLIKAGIMQLQGSTTLLGPGTFFNPVAWGAAENPLTFPAVPVAPAGYGIPCGLFTSATVKGAP